ncbi:MAG: hypothetical protein ABIP20_01650 [Chthoniobacteraceae bacterium]
MLKISYQQNLKNPAGAGRILSLVAVKPTIFLEQVEGNIGVYRLDVGANAHDGRSDPRGLLPKDQAPLQTWKEVQVKNWLKVMGGVSGDFAKAFAEGQ